MDSTTLRDFPSMCSSSSIEVYYRQTESLKVTGNKLFAFKKREIVLDMVMFSETTFLGRERYNTNKHT